MIPLHHVPVLAAPPRNTNPAIAQLVEHLTVDPAAIRWSLVRFRVAGFLVPILTPWRHQACNAFAKHSATGTRTRVARVRAEYPNQLDYSGVAECRMCVLDVRVV